MAVTNQIDVKVGACLRRVRFERNRALADLAAAVGASVEAMLAFENGEQRISAHLMAALCKELNVRPAEFFTWSNELEKNTPGSKVNAA